MEPTPYPTGRILGLNLGVLLVVSIALFAVLSIDSDPYRSLAYGLFMLAYGSLHLLLLLAVGLVMVFIERHRPLGQALLLSALAVLLIGSSFCFGGVFALDAL